MAIKDLLDNISKHKALRAQLLYSPEKLRDEYQLSDGEIDAIKTGELDRLGLSADDLSRLKKGLASHGI